MFLLLLSVQVNAQQETQPLPVDPKVRYGKLDNGLTYYIRHNEQPKDRADFYIAQRVGSILEEDSGRTGALPRTYGFQRNEKLPGETNVELPRKRRHPLR